MSITTMIFFCLLVALTTVAADDGNQLGAGTTQCIDEDGVTLICGKGTFCKVDPDGRKSCTTEHHDHCPREHELVSLTLDDMYVHEDCEKFDANACPDEWSCCPTPKGHRCVKEQAVRQLRDGIDP